MYGQKDQLFPWKKFFFVKFGFYKNAVERAATKSTFFVKH